MAVFVAALLFFLQGLILQEVNAWQFELQKSSDWQYPGRCLAYTLQITLSESSPIKVRIKAPVNASTALARITETKVASSTCGQFTGSRNPAMTSSTSNTKTKDESMVDLAEVSVVGSCKLKLNIKVQLLSYPQFVHGQSVWVGFGVEYVNQSVFAAQQAIRTMKMSVPQPKLLVTLLPNDEVLDGSKPLVYKVKVIHDCFKTSDKVSKSKISIEPPSSVKYTTFQVDAQSVAVNKVVAVGSPLVFETGAMDFDQQTAFDLSMSLDMSQPKTEHTELELVTFYVDVTADGSSTSCSSPNKEVSQSSFLSTTSLVYRPFATCDSALGMETRSIADSMISATSYSDGGEPFKARVNISGAWEPSTAFRKDRRQFLQVNFTSMVKIRRVATQGLCDVFGNSTDKFVKKIKVFFSSNGAFWKPVKEGSKVKVFQANTNCKGLSIIPMPFDIETKFIRVVPVDFEKEIALKVEFYGCSVSSPVSDDDIPNRAIIPYRDEIIVCNTGMEREISDINCYHSSDGLAWKAVHYSVKQISHFDKTAGLLYGVGGREGKLKLRSGSDIDQAWDVISPEVFNEKKGVGGVVLAQSADHLVVTNDMTTLSPLTENKLTVNGIGITWGVSGQGVHSSKGNVISWQLRATWSCKDLDP